MTKSALQSIETLLESAITNDLHKLLHNAVPEAYKQAIKLTSVIIGLTIEHMETVKSNKEELNILCQKINDEISNNPSLYKTMDTEELAIYLAFVAMQENNIWLEESLMEVSASLLAEECSDNLTDDQKALLTNRIYRYISLYFYKSIPKSLQKISKFFANIWRNKKLIKGLEIDDNLENSLSQIIAANIVRQNVKYDILDPPIKLHLRLLNLYRENTIAIGPMIGSVIAGFLGVYTTGILGGLAMSVAGYYLGHIAEKNIQSRNLEQAEKDEKFFLEQNIKKQENHKTPNKSQNIDLGKLSPEISLDLKQSHAKSKQNTKSM